MFVLARLMVKYTAKKLKSIFCLGQPEEGIWLGAKENKLLHIEKNWKKAEEKKKACYYLGWSLPGSWRKSRMQIN